MKRGCLDLYARSATLFLNGIFDLPHHSGCTPLAAFKWRCPSFGLYIRSVAAFDFVSIIAALTT